MRGRRTQAQRDEATVESVYVAASALVLAMAACLVVASPVLLFDAVHGEAGRTLVVLGKAVGAVVFVARLVTGLRGH
ncbi:DUF6332 family protein [Streptomyces fructofermentans]|uniref:DUF6332 family protein n=1 Tax=Streptomyces fructofermentans TaxID=152141 RepID=UPI0037BB35E9